MPVPTSITDLSTTAGSNFPQSTDSCGSTLAQLPQNISAIIKKQFSAGADVAAANGIITLPSDYAFVNITGSGYTITGFADCFNGRSIIVKFVDVNTLTHSASFVLPTAANIATAAGDTAIFVNTSAGVWHCVSYDKAVINSLIPAGTKMPFYQASPPVGWSAVTINSTNDYMMRVVPPAGTGGSYAGSHNPILMNVVPSHNHYISGGTGGQSVPHTHNTLIPRHTYSGSGYPGLDSAGDAYGSQYVTSDTNSTDHTHSIDLTSQNNTSSSNWTPRYADFCIGQKT